MSRNVSLSLFSHAVQLQHCCWSPRKHWVCSSVGRDLTAGQGWIKTCEIWHKIFWLNHKKQVCESRKISRNTVSTLSWGASLNMMTRPGPVLTSRAKQYRVRSQAALSCQQQLQQQRSQHYHAHMIDWNITTFNVYKSSLEIWNVEIFSQRFTFTIYVDWRQLLNISRDMSERDSYYNNHAFYPVKIV